MFEVKDKEKLASNLKLESALSQKEKPLSPKGRVELLRGFNKQVLYNYYRYLGVSCRYFCFFANEISIILNFITYLFKKIDFF